MSKKKSITYFFEFPESSRNLFVTKADADDMPDEEILQFFFNTLEECYETFERLNLYYDAHNQRLLEKQ